MYDELILRLRKDAEFLEISSKYNNTVNEFAERISQAADAIEKLSKQNTVVHCKDCKYCEHTLKRPNVWMPNETCDEHYNCMRIEDGTKPIVFPDSFCSFGKRGEMRVTL